MSVEGEWEVREREGRGVGGNYYGVGARGKGCMEE